MGIENAIYSLLREDAALSALVGERIYPSIFPQGVGYPAVRFMRVTGRSGYHLKGRSGLDSGRWQFDVDAMTDDEAIAVKSAVEKRLSGFSGKAGTPPVAIRGCFKEMDRDGYDGGLAASLPRVFRKTLDFEIWFKDT